MPMNGNTIMNDSVRPVFAKTLAAAVVAGMTLAGMAAVPSPWTPVEAKDGVVSVWGREYAFASNALPVGMKSGGRDLLAGPMRIVCADTNGNPIAWKKGGSWVQEQDDESATVCAWQEAVEIAADATARVEFDGMIKVTLAIVSGPKFREGSISKAWLEIPLKPESATLYVFSPMKWGLVNNTGGVTGPMAWPFRCSVWLGDEKAGLCWFCESDENMRPADPERMVEVDPAVAEAKAGRAGEKETVLRIHLVDKPVELPVTWTFGLQATPVKPWSRAWNARHVMHSPPMGVGTVVKRPEVWWTAQRAFPDGKVLESLDAAKSNGVTTIMFHEDWIPIQNNPSPRSDFKPIVDACHARGIQATAYLGYEISPLDPLWEKYHDTGLARLASGRPLTCWFREPGQRDYRVCYKSGFADDWLARAFKAYDALGLDGFYLDTTITPGRCANEKHGCGWRDASGRLHETYPIFAIRSMMRRLYEFVQSRGGVVNAHQSSYVCPATLAFVHSYWDGEQLSAIDCNVKRTLNLEAFRAEFMGRNHGVPCEFLCYEKPGKWTYDDALALTLLHDVLVRPCGFAAVPRVAHVWKALDAFDFTRAEWIPYWENPVAVQPESVKASVYKKGGESLIVVSNLSPDSAARAEVALPGNATRAHDELANRDVEVSDGKAVLDIPPFRMVLLRTF